MSVGYNPFTQLVVPWELDFNVISPGMVCNDYSICLGHSCIFHKLIISMHMHKGHALVLISVLL